MVVPLVVAGTLAFLAIGLLAAAIAKTPEAASGIANLIVLPIVGDTISELALGRLGAIQAVAFAVAGLGTLAAGIAVSRLTAGRRGSRTGSVLLAINGTALVAAAIFPTDRVDGPVALDSLSVTGVIHVVAAVNGFLAVVAAMLVLTYTFASLPHWCGLTVWSGLLGSAGLSLLFGQALSEQAGLVQRLLATVVSTWIVMVAARAWLSTVRRPTTDAAVPMRHS
jgi:Protein of unknown function (DUF998)